MALRYTIDEVSKNGAVDRRSERYELDEITIGRGNAATIRLTSTLLGLVHLRLTVRGDSLIAEDLGTLSGTKVNDRIISRQELKSGDVLKLGDVTLSVARADGEWTIHEKRQLTDPVDQEAKLKEELTQISLASHLPSYRLLSLFLITAVLAWFFLLPIGTRKMHSWSSGPISNRHVAFAKNCETCHKAPFVPVGSADCLNCHKMSDHSKLLPAGHKLEGECMTCHMEHQGDAALIVHKSQACTSCHAGIKAKFPEAKSDPVLSFARHPEFSVSIPPIDGRGEALRVSLSDRKSLADHSNVKLNHEIHLKGPLRTPTGNKTLNCVSCHIPAADGRSMKPIDFKANCQECHGLGFDPRLPSRQVPHGNTPDEIYTFLYAEYAQFFLASKDSPEAQKSFVRLKPGASEDGKTMSPDEFTRSFVEGETRNTERELFTKTACQLCHEVRPRTDVPAADLEKQGKSLYTLLPPQVPTRWMPRALFSHTAHDVVNCESCHGEVRKSKATSDVMLPGVKRCQSCHADEHSKDLVRSDCTMCHSFHDKLPLEPVKQQRVDELLSGNQS